MSVQLHTPMSHIPGPQSIESHISGVNSTKFRVENEEEELRQVEDKTCIWNVINNKERYKNVQMLKFYSCNYLRSMSENKYFVISLERNIIKLWIWKCDINTIHTIKTCIPFISLWASTYSILTCPTIGTRVGITYIWGGVVKRVKINIYLKYILCILKDRMVPNNPCKCMILEIKYHIKYGHQVQTYLTSCTILSSKAFCTCAKSKIACPTIHTGVWITRICVKGHE